MCGIIACEGNVDVSKVLIRGLKMLQNRGYDSAGICSIIDGFVNVKYASTDDVSAVTRLDKEKARFDNCCIAIGHTRWATHGAKTDENAHPHIDCKNMFSLVHNGIIENYSSIKQFLMGKGYTFVSQTDTEVIVNLISYHYHTFISNTTDLDKEKCALEAIRKAESELDGTWGCVILCIDTPDRMYIMKNGSPLLVGFGENCVIATSEASGFTKFVNKYVILNDRTIATVKFGENSLSNILEQKVVKGNHIHDLDIGNIELSPAPHPHWMIKEIMEQPYTFNTALSMGGRILDSHRVRLGGLMENRMDMLRLQHLIVLGCGTSLNAGMFGAKVLRKIGGFRTVTVIDASEFSVEDLPNVDCDKTGVLVLSQSGETKDVHRAMQLLEEYNIYVFSIINAVESLIAREAKCGAYLNCGRENAVASTKSFTSQVIVMILVAIWFSQNREPKNIKERASLIKSLQTLGDQCDAVLTNIRPRCEELANILRDKRSMFLLGRQYDYPIALEGALKIKEIAYIHAEGYMGGALKHGPFAMIERGTPIVLMITKGDASYQKSAEKETMARMFSAAEEVKSRGAYVIVITDLEENEVCDICDFYIGINEGKKGTNAITNSLLFVLPLQILSYELSIKKGINPDFPRNLAKVVTVDG